MGMGRGRVRTGDEEGPERGAAKDDRCADHLPRHAGIEHLEAIHVSRS